MLVIPAIDIKGGRCVRLKQGKLSEETEFSKFPEEMAVRWHERGAERLHVVDLDGAVQGRPYNSEAIERVVRATPLPVELGGGIREMDGLNASFDIGVQFVVLGTVAHKAPEFVARACEQFPGRIILGVDAKKDRVAVEGWMEEVALSPLKLAKQFDGAALAAVIYTDIRRDGMRTGPNVAATEALARELRTPVIASGGISDLDDVGKLLPLAKCGVIGMITGRALYDGSLDLREAIRLAGGVG